MSILRTENSSPTSDSKNRTDSAKPASVSFGEVIVEDDGDDLSCDGGEHTPMLSSDPTGYKDNAEIRVTVKAGEDIQNTNSKDFGLESRDNPFLPGGDLEKEADDILKRATIVRDRFFLDDGRLRGQALTSESVTLSESSPLYTAGNDTTVMEDSISPQAAASTNAAPDGKPRQNGKLEESSVSPASVKPEVGLDQIDGVTLTDDSTKDKKKQKKCCSIM